MGDFGQPPGGGGGFGQPPAGGGGFGQPPPGGPPPAGGGFGAPPAGGGFGGAAGGGEPKTEVLAIVSLVTGVLGLSSCCCGCVGLVSVAALVTGGLALSKVNKDPAGLKGKELAYVGLALGGLGVLAAIANIILNIVSGGGDFSTPPWENY